MITYGNISFLLSQTQLAKNPSELKRKCFFFKVHFQLFSIKKPKLCFNSLSGEGSILLTITIYTHVSVRNV